MTEKVLLLALASLLFATTAAAGNDLDVFATPETVAYYQIETLAVSDGVCICDAFGINAPSMGHNKCPCQQGSIGLQYGALHYSCYVPYQWPLGDEEDCLTVTVTGGQKKNGTCDCTEGTGLTACCFNLTGTVLLNTCCTVAPCDTVQAIGPGGQPVGPVIDLGCCSTDTISVPKASDCDGAGGGANGDGAAGATSTFSVLHLADCKLGVQIKDYFFQCSAANFSEYTWIAQLRIEVGCICTSDPAVTDPVGEEWDPNDPNGGN